MKGDGNGIAYKLDKGTGRNTRIKLYIVKSTGTGILNDSHSHKDKTIYCHRQYGAAEFKGASECNKTLDLRNHCLHLVPL